MMPPDSNPDFALRPAGNRPRNGTLQILIVDDHAIVREGLKRLVNDQPNWEVSAEAATVAQAYNAIIDSEPQAVITDISLGNGDCIGLIKDLRRSHPWLPILVLSMHDEELYAERMLALGASGYVMKRSPGSELLCALHTVINGGIYLSASMRSHANRPVSADFAGRSGDPREQLSNRELQVLNLLGQGNTTRSVADALCLSIKTVESHRQRIRRKLRFNTGAQLLQFAITQFPGVTQADS